MGPRADDGSMIGILVLIAVLVALGLSVLSGVDSRHVEHGYHRPNLL
jgi:hypothetical protein